MEPPDPLPDLRPLHVLCAAMAASLAILAGMSWLVAGGGAAALGGPPGLPLSLTMAAIVLIVLASRIRSGLLRRAVAPWAAPGPHAIVEAYRKATVASFALLEAAGTLGLVLALVTGSARNGVVVCAASLVAMLARWPRSSELARLVRRRTQGVPPTAPA